ncbi:MAG: phasin family protein [Pikeienuella sp.]
MDTDATKTVEEFTAEAQKTMENSVEKLTKTVEDVAAFGRQNMDAMVLASKRAAKVAEEMNAEIAAYAKKSYEDSLAAAKDMSESKSITELFEKQSAFAKNSMEDFVARTSKVNEMMIAASQEIFAPLTDRVTAAGDLVKARTA